MKGVTKADIVQACREVLGEDDGVGVGLDAGLEQEGLVNPAPVQPHVGAQLVLPNTGVAGVELQVASRERDLLTIEMVDQVGVPDHD